jgi:hypothetical protein
VFGPSRAGDRPSPGTQTHPGPPGSEGWCRWEKTTGGRCSNNVARLDCFQEIPVVPTNSWGIAGQAFRYSNRVANGVNGTGWVEAALAGVVGKRLATSELTQISPLPKRPDTERD